MDMMEPAVAAGFMVEDVGEDPADTSMGNMYYWVYSTCKKNAI
jgi:hypothetical protein